MKGCCRLRSPTKICFLWKCGCYLEVWPLNLLAFADSTPPASSLLPFLQILLHRVSAAAATKFKCCTFFSGSNSTLVLLSFAGVLRFVVRFFRTSLFFQRCEYLYIFYLSCFRSAFFTALSRLHFHACLAVIIICTLHHQHANREDKVQEKKKGLHS